MKSFDFFEFAGLLVPGAVVLVSLLLIYPYFRTALVGSDVSIGDLGLFVVLAYAAGHLIQTIGHGIAWIVWKVCQGMPTDWMRTGKHHLLAEAQVAALHTKLATQLGISVPLEAEKLSAKSWYSITRQIYAAVAAQSRTSRVDIFNGNYSLNRGIATSLLVASILLFMTHGFTDWQIMLLLFVAVVAALYRMYHFGALYARELFVQFLHLPVNEDDTIPPPVNPQQATQNEIVLPEN